jgi:hypothetical protein
VWITREQETVFENMPTLYGPVTLRFRLSADKRRVDIQFHPRWRDAAPKVVLHTSAMPGVTHVVVNGKRYARKEEISL